MSIFKRSHTLPALAALALGALTTGQVLAADLPSRNSTPYGSRYNSGYDWNGFYAGATGNYIGAFKGNGTLALNMTVPDPSGTGYGGGFYTGYNIAIDSFVYGIEVDANMSRLDTSRTTTVGVNKATGKLESKLSGNVLGHLGYAFNQTLIFATIGYGAMQGKLEMNTEVAGFPRSKTDKKTLAGYVFGTGLEYGINKHWTARTEYRYTMYEKTEMAGTKFGADVQEVRAGLGYKF